MTDDEALLELRILWGERGWRTIHPEYGYCLGYVGDDGYTVLVSCASRGWFEAFSKIDLDKIKNVFPN